MKISFSVAAFAAAARAVRDVVNPSLKISIYTHARIEAADGRLAMVMSDMDMEVHVSIDCRMDGDVLAALPRAVLDFFVTREGMGGDEGTIEFDTDMRACTARHGRARLVLAILRGEDFYVMAGTEPTWRMTLRAHELCDALKRTRKALRVGEPTGQPMFEGAFLHRHEASVRIAGADGNRLHLIELDDPELSGAMPKRESATQAGVLLSQKTVKEILRVFGDDESELTLSGTAHMIAVEAGRRRLVSKLLDETYFDYVNRVPARGDCSVTLQCEALSRAMAGILVAPKTDIKGKQEALRSMQLVVGDGTVTLSVKADTGEADDQIEAAVDGAADMKISFAAPYLLDAIAAAGAREITIHMPTQTGMPFHIAGGEGATFVIDQRRL